MGIQIGYDAKRYFDNATGLGNYSRTLIHYLDTYHAANQYVLFVHKKYKSKGFNRFKVVEGTRNAAIWRSYRIKSDIVQSGINLFHGLSGELPPAVDAPVKYIVTIHDVIFKLFPQWYNGIDRMIYNEKLRQAVQKADAIVAISQQTADDLIEHCDLDKEKVSVIGQSWSPQYNKIQQLDDVHVPLLPTDYLLFVGSFYERKNLKTVISAISNPKCADIPLVVVGNGKRRYKRMIMEMIEDLDVSRQVLLLENVHDELLKQLYIRSKAVIYPSLYEGFGLPVLEALKCGKPVITSNNSSLKEFGDKACHLLERPTNPDEMSKAIHDLFYDSGKYDRMVASIPAVIERYHPEKTSAQWTALYESLAGSH